VNVSDLQKVLVADDDALNRQVLGELLMPEYTVLLAKNGAQALERAARHLPDLILLDVVMPDMDGYEVLRRLRADPATAHIAVIFISGLDGPEDEAHGLNSGASDYIAKPFNQAVVMARVALHLQLARQRRMLERLANIDALTELSNRRRFDEIYETEWKRAQRGTHPLSLALLDIDCFKQYNDRYGHPAGDRVLRVVARALAQFVQRPADLVARYGGEEFVLVMPETDAAQARELADKVRQAILALAIAHEASTVAAQLSVSIGGATFTGHGSESAAQLLKAADDHLYCAKQAGRNGVVWRGASV
jgi:diguanylate cyclase (GGDEF)-like protein